MLPIARKTHEERTSDGELLHLIECPNEEFEGRRLGVRFYNGQAKTIYPEKAKYFSEVLGYKVYLHEDMDRDFYAIASEKKSKKQTFKDEAPEFSFKEDLEDYEPDEEDEE